MVDVYALGSLANVHGCVQRQKRAPGHPVENASGSVFLGTPEDDWGKNTQCVSCYTIP